MSIVIKQEILSSKAGSVTEETASRTDANVVEKPVQSAVSAEDDYTADWQERAGCRYLGTEMFFPERENKKTTAAAKAVCMACVVRAECLNYAFMGDEQFGVWGGFTSRERRLIIKKRNARRLAM